MLRVPPATHRLLVAEAKRLATGSDSILTIGIFSGTFGADEQQVKILKIPNVNANFKLCLILLILVPAKIHHKLARAEQTKDRSTFTQRHAKRSQADGRFQALGLAADFNFQSAG